REDEPHQILENGPRDHLAQWASVSSIRPAQRLKVPRPLALLDDRRRVAEPHEDQVHEQSPYSAVSVQERMDALEGSVPPRHGLGDRRWIFADVGDIFDPVVEM